MQSQSGFASKKIASEHESALLFCLKHSAKERHMNLVCSVNPHVIEMYKMLGFCVNVSNSVKEL